MKKVCLYVRVSTNKQTVDNQIKELTEYSNRCGYEIVEIYRDEGISGTKGRDQRPSLNKMMKDSVMKRFEMILCWSIDRLGRSVSHLVQIMNELQHTKTDIFFLQQGIDTSNPTNRLIFGIFSCISEMERTIIRERVISGLERVKRQGKKLGRRSIINDEMRTSVKRLRDSGMSIKSISKQLSCGIGTVYSIMKEG